MRYCGKCGTENNNEYLFCRKCGAKLKPVSANSNKDKEDKKELDKLKETESIANVEQKELVKEESKDNNSDKLISDTAISHMVKPKKKRKPVKIILFILIFLILISGLVGGYMYLNYVSSPEYFVKNYISAIKDKDYEKLYDYVSFSNDSNFINKNNYIELLKEKLSSNISDYEIDSIDYKDDGTRAIVKVEVEYGNKEKNMEVVLVKSDKKQYLIFDSWKLEDQNSIGVKIITNYEIIVPKDTKVTYDGVLLESKYLNNKDAEETVDKYLIPQVFSKETNVSFIFPGGIKLEKIVTPSEYYSSYKLSVSKTDIDTENQEKIETDIKNSLENIMNSIGQKIKFEDISDRLSKYSKDESFDYTYNRYIEKLDKYTYDLTSFTVDEISLATVKYNASYLMVAEVRLNYSWTAKSKTTNEVSSEKSYGFYTCYLNYEDGAYKIVKITTLPNTYAYFSN